MAANLTPQYYKAEENFKAATTPEDKVEALKEMLSVVPKHKGTEKIQGDIKKKLAIFKKESQNKKKSVSTFNPFLVDKEGAGQVVLVGYPNTGKSSLVGSLTRAKTKIGEHPYTTNVPQSGMMPYHDILIQLVDTPPITAESIPPGLTGTFHNADILLIVIDTSSGDCLEQVDETINYLENKNLIALEEKDNIERSKPFIILANKSDLPNSKENLNVVKELKPDITFLEVDYNGYNINLFKEIMFNKLEIIRVYSKPPGKDPEFDKPFILKKGATVLDFAHTVHRDFPDKLKTALVWGSAKFGGQAVAKDFILKDKDIVELQIN